MTRGLAILGKAPDPGELETGKMARTITQPSTRSFGSSFARSLAFGPA
jgi:hypothetical protein